MNHTAAVDVSVIWLSKYSRFAPDSWLTLLVSTVARQGWATAKEPGTQSRSSAWKAGIQLPSHHCLSGRKLESEAELEILTRASQLRLNQGQTLPFAGC